MNVDCQNNCIWLFCALKSVLCVFVPPKYSNWWGTLFFVKKKLAVVDAGGWKCRYSIFIIKMLLTIVENLVFIVSFTLYSLSEAGCAIEQSSFIKGYKPTFFVPGYIMIKI